MYKVDASVIEVSESAKTIQSQVKTKILKFIFLIWEIILMSIVSFLAAILIHKEIISLFLFILSVFNSESNMFNIKVLSIEMDLARSVR